MADWLGVDMPDSTCCIDGCNRRAVARQRCIVHYNRDCRRGLIKPRFNARSFWSKVKKTDTCWNWTSYLDSNGYARFGAEGLQAYRVAYELLVGPIPDGMVLDHKCFNHACVNPDHLRPATHKQNLENRAPRERFGLRGARRRPDGKWRALVIHHGQTIDGGVFNSEEDAAEAARKLRNDLFTHNDLDRREYDCDSG